VWFRTLSEKDIERYWKTGEPRDKAGAYGIQGIGAIFIERLEGSYSGVMGLPLYETAQLLQDFGIQVLD
jgi:septum formation protein